MDLYLSNCLKAAEAAASKVAASNLKVDKDTCSTSKQKTLIPKVGASSLLDLPLGAKLPIIPESTNIFDTTNISEKVICSLRELNKYRHYLTTLKIDFERSYIREQKIIESQAKKINEEKRTSDSATAAEFQQWLLQAGKKLTESQGRFLTRRYCQIIRKELDKIESTLERQNTLQMKEEDRQHWDSVTRRLNQRKEMEEERKWKEIRVLKKISDEFKRQSKVEEHRCKIKEFHRKKQVMQQKRIAYHFQKLQITDDKGEKEGRIFENKRDDKTASTSMQTSASDHKLFEEPQELKFPQIHTRRSLFEESTLQEPLEPKSHHGSVKKRSFAEATVLHESLESKHLYPNTKGSFSDQKMSEEHREQKVYAQNLGISFDEEKSFQELMEAISPPQTIKKPSFPVQKLSQESLDS